MRLSDNNLPRQLGPDSPRTDHWLSYIPTLVLVSSQAISENVSKIIACFVNSIFPYTHHNASNIWQQIGSCNEPSNSL